KEKPSLVNTTVENGKARHSPLRMSVLAPYTERCDCRLDQQRPRTNRKESRFSASAFSLPELPREPAWRRYRRWRRISTPRQSWHPSSPPPRQKRLQGHPAGGTYESCELDRPESATQTHLHRRCWRSLDRLLGFRHDKLDGLTCFLFLMWNTKNEIKINRATP